MSVEMRTGGSAATMAIMQLQRAIDHELSADFLSFVSHHDGAAPAPNRFNVGPDNGACVNRFIPVAEILKERGNVEDIRPYAYPIAWVSGGNYVLIDEGAGGAVVFWDHECPDSLCKLAPDFRTFLELLEPFDLKNIELKPGQVKRVWIDPEFLKRTTGKKPKS